MARPSSQSEVFVMRARHKGRHGQGPVTGRVHGYAAWSPSARFGARVLTEPPAFSTAATADLEAP